jgi:2-polyprenyl-3-methyl-5-hydroxy-6-metoxy-1,4-benzoquinol methylase
MSPATLKDGALNSSGTGKTSYIIRGGAAGRERLRVLAGIHRLSTLNLLRRAGIQPGMVCLDVGCGGGDVSVELARLVAPNGRVVAIDIDEVKIDIARGEAAAAQVANVDFRAANLEDCVLQGEFDVAHARFVLTHLRNPNEALAKIRTALKPGGIVVIADTNFGGLFSQPKSPAVHRYVEIYTATLKRRNGDADIGLRLPALLSQAGFENIQLSVVQHAGMSGDTKLITPITLEGIAEAAIDEGVASRAEIERLLAELYDFARDPNTVLSGPRIIETWARRPAI